MQSNRNVKIAQEEFERKKLLMRKAIKDRLNILQEENQKNNLEMIEIIGMPNTIESNSSNYSKLFKGKEGAPIPNIELLYIANICKKFNVSFNWLTGQSSINNRQDKYKDIVSTTPLTEDSIEMLEKLKRSQTITKYKRRIDLLNYIIETLDKEDGIIDVLVQYLFPDFEEQEIHKQIDGYKYSRTFKEEDVAKLFLFNIESGLIKERKEFKKYRKNKNTKRNYTTFD